MKSYIPPKKAQVNAKIARKCLMQGSRAMLRVGRYRSAQLANRTPLSYSTVKRMAAFYRHKKNAEYSGNPCKDKGYVAWQGWGGTEGINWARRIVKQQMKGGNSKK